MYKIKRVGILDKKGLKKVAVILNACGKDMAEKYDLHHWDNPFFKTLLIVYYCAVKNKVYLLSDETKPVATFMTKTKSDVLHFEKLGTLPSESGKGIGSLCMERIYELARADKCKKIVMEVYGASTHAISFYEQIGYKAVDTDETLKYKTVKMEKVI